VWSGALALIPGVCTERDPTGLARNSTIKDFKGREKLIPTDDQRNVTALRASTVRIV